MSNQPEAFSRVLIDQALKDSGWNLLDSKQVRFELQGHSGRADYVLSGQHGSLCVLEAKRPDQDPYDAKEQARGVAEYFEEQYDFVVLREYKPVIFKAARRKPMELLGSSAEIRALESQQAASRRRLDGLFQSMLHRAFQGGL